MTGIFFLGAVGLWLVIALFISVFVARKLSTSPWHLPLTAIMFLALAPLPLIDEIVGGMQFKQLCEEHSTIQVNRSVPAGTNIYLRDVPDIKIEDLWVPVRLQPWRFLDAVTGEPIISYDILYATGGSFIRMLGISEGSVPLTFKDSCAPGGRVDIVKLLSELRVTQIDRPVQNREGTK